MRYFFIVLSCLSFSFSNAQEDIFRLTEYYEDYQANLLLTKVYEQEGAAGELKELAQIWVLKEFGNIEEFSEQQTESSITVEWVEQVRNKELGLNRDETYMFKMLLQFRDGRYKASVFDQGATTGENYEKPLSYLFHPKKFSLGKKELTGDEFVTRNDEYEFAVLKTYKNAIEGYLESLKTSLKEASDW